MRGVRALIAPKKTTIAGYPAYIVGVWFTFDLNVALQNNLLTATLACSSCSLRAVAPLNSRKCLWQCHRATWQISSPCRTFSNKLQSFEQRRKRLTSVECIVRRHQHISVDLGLWIFFRRQRELHFNRHERSAKVRLFDRICAMSSNFGQPCPDRRNLVVKALCGLRRGVAADRRVKGWSTLMPESPHKSPTWDHRQSIFSFT